jgi:hypothetical protein
VKRYAIIAALTLMLSTMVGIVETKAAEIEGVYFPDQFREAEEVLTLRGVGLVRRLFFVKLLVAGLYLQEGVPADQALSDVAKRLEMQAFRAIAGSEFAQEAEQALLKNVPPSTITALRPSIDRLHAAYEDLNSGDRYALTYSPDSGTQLELNGRVKVIIDGPDFATAYFAIWLGPHPISIKLKAQMLGTP